MVNKKQEMPYLERDVSWMYFNRRILQEATRKHIPLLERFSFLGIYSNNLDEFFRVRVATQSRIAECVGKAAADERDKATKIIKQINKLNSQYSLEYEHSVKIVTEELRQEGIFLVNDKEITDEQLQFIRQYYRDNLNGFIMPVWLSAIKMLDNEADESIYLGVKFRYESGKKQVGYAYLELPVSIAGRFVCLPDCDGKKYVMYLDDVVRCCLPLVFEGLGLNDFEAYSFKFTRDAEMEIDNDLRTGTLQKISKGNAQDDQDTDTLHGASESGRQSCRHIGQRHSCQDTHDQSAKQQRQERMQIKFDNGHQNENQRHCKYSK